VRVLKNGFVSEVSFFWSVLFKYCFNKDVKQICCIQFTTVLMQFSTIVKDDTVVNSRVTVLISSIIPIKNFLLVTVVTVNYCKTLYFRCILISRFWNVEISLHFNLAFCQCSVSIYQAFGVETEFSRVLNFAILSYLRNSRKFDACEKYVLQ